MVMIMTTMKVIVLIDDGVGTTMITNNCTVYNFIAKYQYTDCTRNVCFKDGR